MAAQPTLSTAHALLVLAFGVLGVLAGASAAWVAGVAAYVMGADVLWRMTEASVFDQYGKYGIALLLVLWMVRNRRLRLRPGPLLYFSFLLPSIVLVVAAGGRYGNIQRPLSFNLSGPFALMVCVLFFRQVTLNREQLLRVLAAALLPVFSVLAIAASTTLAASKLSFSGSNLVTSGGYGPNQVSATLGLGCLLALLLVFFVRTHVLGRALLITACLLLGLQTALTFSRGGLYSAGAALLVALPFLFATRSARLRLLGGTAIVALLVTVVLVPWLQDFTGGAFLRRMGDTGTTGRDKLMARDLSLWTENAFLGVGPGMSKLTDAEGTNIAQAHTELTRLIAEHGALGAFAALTLLAMAFETVRKAPPGVPRGLAACFLAWSTVYMLHAAMRLAAPSYLFGLAAAMPALHLPERPAADVAPAGATVQA